MPYCPECGGKLKHIHRRGIDRFYNALIPIKRYRCRSVQCDWEGNLRQVQKNTPLFKWIGWGVLLVGAVSIGKILAGFR
jgi:hypothetical protein